MSKKHQIKAIVLTALCAAVLTACGGGGGGSPSTASTSNALVDNAKSARAVIEQIEALPAAEALTPADVAKVAAAFNAFNALNNDSKAMVGKTNTDKLQGLIDAANKMIVKAFSGGTSAEDVSKQTGAAEGSNYALGKANFDAKIETLYTDLEAAKKALASAADAAAQAEAQAKVDELQKSYDN